MSLLDEVASSQKLRRQMRDAISRSKNERVEMAFPICLNGEGIVAGEREMTKGTETGTGVILACPATKGDLLGSFHTHVVGVPYPSRLDILNMGKEKVTCTGQDNKITCLSPKPGTGPEQLKETVDQINYYTTPWSLAPESRYWDAVKKRFEVKEFSV